MAAPNGVLIPPLHSEHSTLSSMQSAKRKREDTTQTLPNGIANTNSEPAKYTSAASKSLVRDLIDVLKEIDTTPSILEHPIQRRPSLSSPTAKRQKSDDSDVQRSILRRQSDGTYQDVDEVLEDISLAVTAIMDSLQLPAGNVRLSEKQVNISVQVKAFQQKAHELVEREKTLEENSRVVSIGAMSPRYSTNGSASVKTFTQLKAGATDDKMVLTLYGGAPGAKQMFSSLQIPVKEEGPRTDMVGILREVGLPNGIIATQVVSPDGPTTDQKRVPTLGELFPTPPKVPSLQPPQPSKTATTRSGTVGFYQPFASEPPDPTNPIYAKQPISFGKWIDYTNASTSPQGIKRKRDRASSVVGAKAIGEPDSVESEAAKIEALFRSAYSGFAPTIDDSAAIAPSGVMNRVWWQKLGEEAFEKMVQSTNTDVATNENASETMGMTQSFSEVQLEEIEKMIAEVENGVIDPNLDAVQFTSEKSVEEKDVEEILQGISELLETLNSHQRIRHMSLSSTSRPAGLLSAPDATSLPAPVKPSDSEQATYEIIKSQLTLMIASLPPYAVAKLDANRLADLSISTKIEVQLNNYNGVMEEDEAASRAKVAALSASSSVSRIAPPPATTAHRASSTTLYGNQYASRTSSVPANQYYANVQAPVRPPSSNLQRPPAPAPIPAYQPQRSSVPAAVSTPYRPNPAYGTATAYQAPRPAQPSYGTPAPMYMTNSGGQASYIQQPSQTYQHGPQAPLGGQMNARYANSPAYPHQGASQPSNAQYRYGNSAAFPRQASPHNPVYSPQAAPSPAPVQGRGGYPAAGTPIVPQARGYIQAPVGTQQAMHGNGSHSPAPQYPGSSGYTALNYATVMSQQEQSNLMDRQRSVLAAHQQQTQQNARNAAMGGASNGQVNGNGTNPVAAGL